MKITVLKTETKYYYVACDYMRSQTVANLANIRFEYSNVNSEEIIKSYTKHEWKVIFEGEIEINQEVLDYIMNLPRFYLPKETDIPDLCVNYLRTKIPEEFV